MGTAPIAGGVSAESVIEWRKGDTETYTGFVTRDGVAVRIDGAGVKLWFTAKRSRSDTDASAALKKGTTNTGRTGITILDDGTVPLRGKYQVQGDPADTAVLTDRALWFDVQLLETNDAVSTVDAGILRLLEQQTVAIT